MSFMIIFTNALWYFEFFVFVVILVLFFFYVIYIAGVNYTPYNMRFDIQRKSIVIAIPKPPRDRRPFYCDPGCIWYTRLVFSILTIGICYVFAYSFIYDTKLRFGLFL